MTSPEHPSSDHGNHDHDMMHERYEVEIDTLADTVLKGLELGEALETYGSEPTSCVYKIAVPPSLTPEISSTLPGVAGSDVELTMTYTFTFLATRPSLELLFTSDYDETGTPMTLASIQKPSGDMIPIESPYTGSLIRSGADERPIHLDPETIAELLENILTLDGIYISDEGIARMRLLQEIISDPQNPPLARFIKDSLVEKGADVVTSQEYSLEIDGTNYIIRTVSENGHISEVSIIEILSNELSIAPSGDMISEKPGLGARISHTRLSQAVEFFTSEAYSHAEKSYEGDYGDLMRLRETLLLLNEKLRVKPL